MSRAENLPTDADLLCEGCGYVLNGLPQDTRCPECGKPAAESAASLRADPSWETALPGRRLSALGRDTVECIFIPRRFFRSLSVRPAGPRSRLFARTHWLVAAALFGTSAWMHSQIMGGFGPLLMVSAVMRRAADMLALPLFLIVTYLFLYILNSLAARLTTFEATYRGIRLPRPVVLRVLHYHAAHYLPVGLLAIATVGTFELLLRYWPGHAYEYEMTYLYVLCGEVIVSAAYLFKTYWTAMRNTMYANRSEIVTRQDRLGESGNDPKLPEVNA